MKQAGIVFLVRFIEKMEQPLINILPILQRHKPAIIFNTPIFADTEKYDPVDSLLNGEVQFPLGKVRIAQRDAAGHEFPPVFDLLQEFGIDFGG